MMQTDIAAVPRLYQAGWLWLMRGYGANTTYPATFLGDIFPWFGQQKQLEKKLAAALVDAQVDDALRGLLTTVSSDVANINGNASSVLIRLPYPKAVMATYNKQYIDAYFMLDRFLDSIDIVLSALQFGQFTEPKYLEFLKNEGNLRVFEAIGVYLHAADNR